MIRGLALHIAGRWFAAWASRAERIARRWSRRAARWRRRSEKFFHRLNGGRS